MGPVPPVSGSKCSNSKPQAIRAEPVNSCDSLGMGTPENGYLFEAYENY